MILTGLQGLNGLSAVVYVLLFFTGKPTVETPKVKRLCSLASYKPQFPSFLSSGDEKNQKAKESVSSTKKGFMPGMFKER